MATRRKTNRHMGILLAEVAVSEKEGVPENLRCRVSGSNGDGLAAGRTTSRPSRLLLNGVASTEQDGIHDQT
jgi:hypothetical protein